MLLARIYGACPLTGPQCGAEMRIIAFIREGVDVRAILEHIGAPVTPPRVASARGPPSFHEDAVAGSIDAEDDLIYHIFVDGVAIKNPHIEGGVQDVLPHAPVDEKTLELSLIKLTGTANQLPDISEGYSVWKEAFDSGEGGVFNISVSQIIEYIEQVVGQNA
ncbi:MAG: hypothetical protein ACFCBW_17115 [Candidatus Competibacterales bacterium]